MPTISGFSDTEAESVRGAMLVAKLCIEAALKEAFFDDGGFSSRIGKYFGSNEAGTHAIMKTINSMKLLIETDVYCVKRGGDIEDSNAKADHFTTQSIVFGGSDARQARTARLQGTMMYEGKRVNHVESVMTDAPKNGAFEMELFDNFFGLPYMLQDSQSQIETFLHELSHVAAGTKDVDAPSCYGWGGVQYCKSIKKGTENAESYGMFLQSYIG